MKTIQAYSITRKYFWLFLISLMVFSLDSCVSTTKFARSTIVPGAEGVVKVKEDKNNNYLINVTLTNLAEPKYLQPAKDTYVVWMEGEDNETKNIGQVKSSSSFISKKMKGSFETVSSIKPRKIFITAENDPKIKFYNSSDIILTTNYLKD